MDAPNAEKLKDCDVLRVTYCVETEHATRNTQHVTRISAFQGYIKLQFGPTLSFTLSSTLSENGRNRTKWRTKVKDKVWRGSRA